MTTEILDRATDKKNGPEWDPGYAVYAADSLEEYKSGLFKKNLYRHIDRPGKIPVILFPPIGNTDAGIEYLVRRSGLLTLTAARREYGISDSLLPPPVTDEMILRGLKNSPQPICFPFKITLGSMLLQLEDFKELNAKSGGIFYPLVVTHQSAGFCRERCYGTLAEMILRNLKEDCDFYSVNESKRGIWDLASMLSGLSRVNNWGIIDVLNSTLERMDMLGRFEDKVRYTQSSTWKEKDKYHIAEDELTVAREQVASVAILDRELKSNFAERLERIEKIRGDEKPEAIVSLLGEALHEAEFMRSGSYGVGRYLVKEGVYFERLTGLDHYFSLFRLDPQTLVKYFINKAYFWKESSARKAAKAGLEFDPGGHSVKIMAEVLDQRQKGTYDGVVTIGPFNCGPMGVINRMIERVLRPKTEEIELFGRATDPGLGTPIFAITIDEQAARMLGSTLTLMESSIDSFKARAKRRNN